MSNLKGMHVSFPRPRPASRRGGVRFGVYSRRSTDFCHAIVPVPDKHQVPINFVYVCLIGIGTPHSPTWHPTRLLIFKCPGGYTPRFSQSLAVGTPLTRFPNMLLGIWYNTRNPQLERYPPLPTSTSTFATDPALPLPSSRQLFSRGVYPESLTRCAPKPVHCLLVLGTTADFTARSVRLEII